MKPSILLSLLIALAILLASLGQAGQRNTTLKLSVFESELIPGLTCVHLASHGGGLSCNWIKYNKENP